MGFFGNGAPIFLDPTIERCMIQIDATFGHDLLKIPIRDTKADELGGTCSTGIECAKVQLL
jgi:hypothetical protein